MSEPRILWLKGPGPTWPGLLDGLGASGQVDAEVDVTSMRDVRSVAQKARPDAILYVGPRDEAGAEADPNAAFLYGAEAPIGVAAAALELSALAVFLSHPIVFGGAPGRHREAEEPNPGSILGEALVKGETFIQRAARGDALVVRAGPVLSQDLADERSRITAGGVRPVAGRQLTPVTDEALGRALRGLVLAKVQGIVHVGGPSVAEEVLWEMIARTVSTRLMVRPVLDRSTESWALASERDLPFDLDWRSVLVEPTEGLSVEEGALDPQRCPSPQQVFAGELPPGRTGLGEGLAAGRLGPGARLELLGWDRAIVVRSGKLVLELPGTDLVLRGGQRVDLPGQERASVVAVDDSELIIVEGPRG